MNIKTVNNDAYTLLSNLLIEQISSLKKATVYLNDIKASIESNDLKALQTLIQHNDMPISQIENQEKLRFSLMTQYGFENTKEGFSQCIASFDHQDKSLKTLQESLIDSINELQTATMVSDLLITKNKQRVTQSLSILTGTTLQKSHTYSSSGNKPQDSLSRPLATA